MEQRGSGSKASWHIRNGITICRDVLFGRTDSFANRLGPPQRNRNESVVLEKRFRTPRSNQVKGRASRKALTSSGRTMRRRSAGGAILKHPKRNLKSTPTSIRTLQYFSQVSGGTHTSTHDRCSGLRKVSEAGSVHSAVSCAIAYQHPRPGHELRAVTTVIFRTCRSNAAAPCSYIVRGTSTPLLSFFLHLL